MTTKLTIETVRKFALRELQSKSEYRFAIYGFSYNLTADDKRILKIAETPADIKYFMSEDKLQSYIQELHRRYEGVDDFHTYVLDKENI